VSLAGASTLAVGVLLGCSRPTERADAAQQRPTSADDGRQRWRLRPSSARLGRLEWGVDGAFAMSCYRHQIGGESLDRHVDIVRNGKIEQVVDLGDRSIQASHSVGDASGMAWSPSGDGLALLLDRQEVMLVDTRTGKKITAFTSPAPPRPPRNAATAPRTRTAATPVQTCAK